MPPKGPRDEGLNLTELEIRINEVIKVTSHARGEYHDECVRIGWKRSGEGLWFYVRELTTDEAKLLSRALLRAARVLEVKNGNPKR